MKKNNNETLLTEELYEEIVSNVVKDIVSLKKEQAESLSKISIQKEALKNLNDQLKLLKKNIKTNKKTLRTEQSNLRKINNKLNNKNNRIVELNNSFVTEEESYIDLNLFAEKVHTKKR